MKRHGITRLLVVALLAMGGVNCSSDAPTAASPAIAGPQSLLAPVLDGAGSLPILKGLLKCDPMPYASARKLIGPRGGTLQIGPHTLVVPAGALSAPTWIRGQAPTDSVNSVRFFPEGLTFNPKNPARLTLDYSNCSLLRNLLPKRIVYTTERLRVLELLASIDDLLRRKVSANLEHFSRYAVAW